MFRRPLYLSRHNSEPTKSIMSIRIHTFLLTEKEASTSKRSTVQGLTAGRKERAGRWSSPPPSCSGRRRGGGRPRRRAGTRRPSPARPQHLPAPESSSTAPSSSSPATTADGHIKVRGLAPKKSPAARRSGGGAWLGTE